MSGMIVVGFLRDKRFVVYSCGERLGVAMEQASSSAKL